PSHARHRDHTSFPTRRSSDLALDESNPPVCRRTAIREHRVCSEAGSRPGAAGTGATAEPEGTATEGKRASETGDGAPASGTGSRDRKSTRLNSSHRTISYAVF